MILKYLVLALFVSSVKHVTSFQSAFDQDLYNDVLDSEMCQYQLGLLSNNSLLYQFYDASFKIPSGIGAGNINDLGDYHYCLSIDQVIEDAQIQGKYCSLIVPTDQEFIDWPSIEWPDWNITLPNITLPNITLPEIDTETRHAFLSFPSLSNLQALALKQAGIRPKPESRVFPAVLTAQAGATLAVCIPKVCTPREAMWFFSEITPFLDISFIEYYCRLPNDKPLSTVDYVAIGIFSFIGMLLIMSTTYDLMQTFYYKEKPSKNSQLYRSFSVYTNTRRLLTFNSPPGTLECLDGIRSISMMWVVVGHTFSFTMTTYIDNLLGVYDWILSFNSAWINSAPITVDTFFLLSGILVVYTTVGKISRGNFFRRLHLFYLNRILRMFPLLATVVLLQASLINHWADGPFWVNVALSTENCRKWWWAILLHVQNYVNPLDICLPQSWYLSVDTQLYFVAPLVLWFLWSHPRLAWSSLCFTVLLALTSSTVYSFTFNFSAALFNLNRLDEFNDYLMYYYLNTLTRAPPFAIGMVYGYLLFTYRNKKIRISWINSIILWSLSFLMMAFCIFSIHPVMQVDHDAQIFDNFLNAYMRAIWACGLGWLIFACVKGYGGPVNWFLSLQLWKLPARLSFAMYLIHVSIIFVGNGTWVKTHYFSNGEAMYRFAADFTYSFLAALVLCICVDAPFSTLQKLLLGGGKKPPRKPVVETSKPAIIENDKHIVKTSL